MLIVKIIIINIIHCVCAVAQVVVLVVGRIYNELSLFSTSDRYHVIVSEESYVGLRECVIRNATARHVSVMCVALLDAFVLLFTYYDVKPPFVLFTPFLKLMTHKLGHSLSPTKNQTKTICPCLSLFSLHTQNGD